MIATARRPSPPSDDKRWKIVNATIRRHGAHRHALIETLHTVQECFGCLDAVSLQYVANSLRVPLSSVYGVATFYHFFKLTPPGEHTCVVCTGTACYIKQAQKLIEQVGLQCGIAPDQTTPDGKVSLLTARCLGACSMASAVVFDGEMVGNVDEQALNQRLNEWLNHES